MILFGRDLIAFIKRNQLEDVRILEGDDQDLPGYVTVGQLSKDLGLKIRQIKKLIDWGLIPDAVHIGKVWYVPCDLVMYSPALFKLTAASMEIAADEQPAPDPDPQPFTFGG